MVTSIIKETDLDPHGELSSGDLGACGLYDLLRLCPRHLHYASKNSLDFYHHALFNALVCMKALQDMCVANKRVIRRFRKRQEIENKEKEQYK